MDFVFLLVMDWTVNYGKVYFFIENCCYYYTFVVISSKITTKNFESVATQHFQNFFWFEFEFKAL